jgi:hypothetical protein
MDAKRRIRKAGNMNIMCMFVDAQTEYYSLSFETVIIAGILWMNYANQSDHGRC